MGVISTFIMRGKKSRFDNRPTTTPSKHANVLYLEKFIRSQDITVFEPLQQSVKGRGQAQSDDNMGN